MRDDWTPKQKAAAEKLKRDFNAAAKPKPANERTEFLKQVVAFIDVVLTPFGTTKTQKRKHNYIPTKLPSAGVTDKLFVDVRNRNSNIRKIFQQAKQRTL